MNDRQRILSILNGSKPDRIPWIPRLEIWYEAARQSGKLPQRWNGLELREIERNLGVGTPAREGKIFEISYDRVEVLTMQEGESTILTYKTPVGDLRQVTRQSEERKKLGLPGVVAEHLLKYPEDYVVWEYIVKNRIYKSTFREFEQYDQEIGDEGLPMIQVSPSPFYYFLEVLVGYNNAFFHLADYPKEVNHLLSVMADVQKEKEWPLIIQSPGKLILTDAHISSQFTPPKIYKKYILPYHLALNELIHANGKWSAMHADADTSRILGLILETGWDMVECFVTEPMVPVTLAQAKKCWGNHVVIWGGIPSLILSPTVSETDFRTYVDQTFDVIAPGDAFILGVADNVMADSIIDRIAWISEQVDKRGWYPIELRGI